MSDLNVKELQQQLSEIQAQLEKARSAERAAVIAQVRELVSLHGLVVDDIFSKTRSANSGVKVAAKFRDGENTWSGRGIKPKWLKAHLDAGRDINDFAV
jgi:DNA-binding protein H-NS